MKNVLVFIAVLAALIVGFWWAANTWLLTDGQKIERVIEKGRRGMECGSIFAVRGVLASNYQNEEGLDAAMTLRALADFFQNTENRSIAVNHSAIDVEEGTGRASATVAATVRCDAGGGAAGFLGPGTGRIERTLRVRLELTEETGGWKISYSEVSILP